MTALPDPPADPTFEPWLELQLARSAVAMRRSISPLSLVKHRPGFGQTVTPVAGAIVASPVPGDWDPAPDYFFHWFRDAAVVIDALRLLHLEGRVGAEALRDLADHTRFSLALNRLDGRVDAAVAGRRARVAPAFLQYLRDDADLARAQGDGVAAETRVNPDGTLDVSRWARPQHDGPPLRAVALLRWVDLVAGAADAALAADLAALIRFDLDFTLHHWHEPSYDIWEEDNGHHYYTLRLSAAAFEAGAAWLQRGGEAAHAQRLRQAAQAVRQRLDGFWVPAPEGDTSSATPTPGDHPRGHYQSRLLADGTASPKALDIAVILSAVHAGATEGPHSVADPRLHATLDRLDALFDAAYPLNHRRPPGRGPAMGRYAGDVYFSGGAYYFSSLGAAEFCFRVAGLGGVEAPRWFARGDAYLATVRDHTPADGALSEQFDQASGAQTSAQHLAWSYAAFISCVAARRGASAASPRGGSR